ncbi:MAG: CYTH domain-containing protein, partial [Pirellula sp.]
MQSQSLEAECKYRARDLAVTRQALIALSAEFVCREEQCDTYLRHPSRNFRETDEALRIREIDGKPFVTYKGPRLAGPIRIRPEIELPLAPGTVQD